MNECYENSVISHLKAHKPNLLFDAASVARRGHSFNDHPSSSEELLSCAFCRSLHCRYRTMGCRGLHKIREQQWWTIVLQRVVRLIGTGSDETLVSVSKFRSLPIFLGFETIKSLRPKVRKAGKTKMRGAFKWIRTYESGQGDVHPPIVFRHICEGSPFFHTHVNVVSGLQFSPMTAKYWRHRHLNGWNRNTDFSLI